MFFFGGVGGGGWGVGGGGWGGGFSFGVPFKPHNKGDSKAKQTTSLVRGGSGGCPPKVEGVLLVAFFSVTNPEKQSGDGSGRRTVPSFLCRGRTRPALHDSLVAMRVNSTEVASQSKQSGYLASIRVSFGWIKHLVEVQSALHKLFLLGGLPYWILFG